MKFRLYIFCWMFLFPVYLFGQSATVSLVDGEKIYVHTDRDYYIGGSDIFCKIYLRDIERQLSGLKSQIAYVDLINEESDIIDSKTVRISDGTGEASFALMPGLKAGRYVLRAYTRYMQNEDDDFYFRKSIFISDYQRQAVNDGRVENLEDDITIRFFPEGGDLIDGLVSQVAIKVNDHIGQGFSAKISIKDQSGKQVITVQTDDKGYAKVELVASANEVYDVFIDDVKHKLAKLPAVKSDGAVMKVDITDDVIILNVDKTSSEKTAGDLICVIHTMNKVIMKKVIENQTGKSIQIPLSDLPMGINHLTVFNQHAEPLCERLVFNHIGTNDYNLDINMEAETFGKRELVNIELDQYNDEGDALASDLSVSVVDQYLTSSNVENHDIRSSMFFGSELRGHINQPTLYLSDLENPDIEGIDLLMMTHGWRAFKEDVLHKVYEAESALSISGRVHKKDNPDKPVKAVGNLSVLSGDFFYESFQTDADGNFKIEGLSLQDSVSIMFQAAVAKKNASKQVIESTKLKGNRNVDIVIHESQDAKVSITDEKKMSHSNFQNELEIDKNSIVRFNEININQSENEEILMSLDIDEVEVRAVREKEVVSYHKDAMLYSKPGTRIFTEDMPLVDSYADIYSMLRGRVPGLQLDAPETSDDGKHTILLRGRSTIKLSNSARFMINGSFVSTNTAEAISPTQIAFIDVLSSLSELAPYGELGSNGLIMIYLKPPGSRKNDTPKSHNGILNYIYKGYHTAREFYSPDYMQNNNEKDYRVTLYWNPNIIVDESGTAYFQFYTGDRSSQYRIQVEGMTADGLPVTAQSKFVVND